MGIALIKGSEEGVELEPRSYRAIDADAHIIEGAELFATQSATRERATVAEQGFQGYQVTGWIALMAPKGTSHHVVSLVHKTLYFQPVVNTPEQFAAEWKAERDTWELLIKARDIRID